MPQCGEIVVERLTGNRAMVIRVLSPEEVTCRFGDGRLEDRFTFELEPLLSLRDPRGGGRFVPLGSLALGLCLLRCPLLRPRLPPELLLNRLDHEVLHGDLVGHAVQLEAAV